MLAVDDSPDDPAERRRRKAPERHDGNVERLTGGARQVVHERAHVGPQHGQL